MGSKYQRDKTWLCLTIIMLGLSGCDAVDNTVSKASHGLRTSYDNTRYRLADAIYHRDPQNQPPIFVPHASDFCYKVLMDTVCYDRPQPQLHMGLVGVQGDQVASYSYDNYLPENLREGGMGQSENSQMTGDNAPLPPLGSNASTYIEGEHIGVSDLDGTAAYAGARPTPFSRGDASVIMDPHGNPKAPAPILNYNQNTTRSTSAIPAKLMGK